MEQACELSVRTYGRVCDLGRVVGVLALLDLTPAVLTCRAEGGGLRVEMRILTDARSRDLCVSRLRALACVASARLTLAPHGETGKPFTDACSG